MIASTTSLVVAVVGLIANGRGQRRASQQAHANALALFERQAIQQAAAREKESNERLHLAHLETKRRAYARLPGLLAEIASAQSAADADAAFYDAMAKENRLLDGGFRDPDKMERIYENSQASLNRYIALAKEGHLVSQEIDLLAPDDVAQAAMAWSEAVVTDRQSETADLAEAFSRLARQDLRQLRTD